jgi:hypothetical protein
VKSTSYEASLYASFSSLLLIRLFLVHIFSSALYSQGAGIALGHGLDDRGFELRQGLGIFFFIPASRPALGPTQPPMQWVPGALSLGVKRLGREADQSPPSTEVKECVVPYFYSSNTPSWRGAQLKHRVNFTFYLLLGSQIPSTCVLPLL